MRADHLAKEAERLLADAVLKQALADMRRDGLEMLVTVDPENTVAVVSMQEYVRAIDEFQRQLRSYILAIGQDE